MRPAAEEHHHRLGRSTYALLAGAFAAFVIYGSLVPLHFQPLSLERALEQFARIFYRPLSIDSRADFVTNILLFIPLGYLVQAALSTGRPGRVARVAAALLTIATCFALCVVIEFTQAFFPGRTVALSDITAETIGGALGVTLWLCVGNEVTAWARDFSRERERPVLVQRLLLAYCVLLVVSQLMPFDLTINLGELARKYRDGRIVLAPFGNPYSSWLAMAWDYLSDITLNAPVGAAAVLLWTTERSRRHPALAVAIGVAFVVLVELAQIFVNSRLVDVTDVVTGSVGVALGVAGATAFSERPVLRTVRERPGGVAAVTRIAAVVWIGVLVCYHWYPFSFSFGPDRVVLGVHQLLSVPFSSYYLGTELHAFTEMSRKSLLALPLGVLLGLSWPVGGRAPQPRLRSVMIAVGAFCVLFAIEIGQVFLQSRVPDVTDAIVGEAGVVAGLWLAGVLAAPLKDRALEARAARGV